MSVSISGGESGGKVLTTKVVEIVTNGTAEVSGSGLVEVLNVWVPGGYVEVQSFSLVIADQGAQDESQVVFEDEDGAVMTLSGCGVGGVVVGSADHGAGGTYFIDYRLKPLVFKGRFKVLLSRSDGGGSLTSMNWTIEGKA